MLAREFQGAGRFATRCRAGEKDDGSFHKGLYITIAAEDQPARRGITFVGIVAENALLPAALTDFVWWDVFLAVSVYAAVPLPFPRQAALAAVISSGDLLVLWQLKSPGPLFSMLDVTLAYACANIAGAFVSQERHTWRRRAFLAFRQEVATRRELQAALHEVKTLQGIIPICSHCKNIRSEKGDWQHIEAYVHSHSDAEFSHGVCPDCMRLHYPDFADE